MDKDDECETYLPFLYAPFEYEDSDTSHGQRLSEDLFNNETSSENSSTNSFSPVSPPLTYDSIGEHIVPETPPPPYSYDNEQLDNKHIVPDFQNEDVHLSISI